ncbi:MAG: Do family serine endopeptidase [Prevotella sp.]|jgi:Do/DeqQ family serine protease|nr:Do family serine endopeptidase [Prevotella sp.]
MKKAVKNVLMYVGVMLVSAGATFATYSYLENRNHTGSADVYSSFSGQMDAQNLHLASLTAEGYPDFTKAAENAVHAVVHIKSTVTAKLNNRYGRSQQYVPIDPFDFFFGNPFGGQQPQATPQPQVGYGSGVIISTDGYIITNNHVIDKANEIEVTLNDNSKYSAKLIGADPQTDIALLKIDGKDFPIVPFGNSDALKVGEWVLAVGNPFNLNSTVTAGIVSAKSRGGVTGGQSNGGVSGSIQSFIQTDAAINPGNSGGALINTKGELVGINTAIYSQTGNFTGYGFAVPVSIAGKVVADLKEYGAVQRAVLGVVIRDVASQKEIEPEKTKDITVNEGVYVADFAERSPAKEAGMEAGDVIVAIDGVKVRNSGELQDQVNKHRPGDKVKVTLKRKSADKTIEVVLKNNSGNTSVVKKTDALADIGAAFKSLSSEAKQKFGVSYGVEVAGVDNDGKFRKVGISKGFIILKINNQPVSSPEDIDEIVVETAKSSDKVLFIAGFYPNGRTKYYAIDLNEEKE